MDKPISIILTEAKQEIAKTINNIGLHPMLLEPILKEFYLEVQQAALQQYRNEKTEYEKSLTNKTDEITEE